jgi:cytochrome b561
MQKCVAPKGVQATWETIMKTIHWAMCLHVLAFVAFGLLIARAEHWI